MAQLVTQQDTQPPAETLAEDTVREAIITLDVFLAAYARRSDDMPVYLDRDDDNLLRWGHLRTILAALTRRAGGDAIPAGERAITGVQNDKRFNCFGIPDSYKGYAIHQGPDDLFYASLSAATWDELQDILDHPPAAPKPRAGGECLSSPDGRHQVDTSMESGSNNCFHCEAPMGGTNAR